MTSQTKLLFGKRDLDWCPSAATYCCICFPCVYQLYHCLTYAKWLKLAASQEQGGCVVGQYRLGNGATVGCLVSTCASVISVSTMGTVVAGTAAALGCVGYVVSPVFYACSRGNIRDIGTQADGGAVYVGRTRGAPEIERMQRQRGAESQAMRVYNVGIRDTLWNSWSSERCQSCCVWLLCPLCALGQEVEHLVEWEKFVVTGKGSRWYDCSVCRYVWCVCFR